jgi:nucleoid DNA-binding protein
MSDQIDDLIKLYMPKIRKISFEHNTDKDDVIQEAWLLALLEEKKHKNVRVGCWLVALEKRVRAQAHWSSSDEQQASMEEMPGGVDPASLLSTLETVQEVAIRQFGGLEAAIEAPKTARELAQATGKSERQCRRDIAALRAANKLQACLLEDDLGGGWA